MSKPKHYSYRMDHDTGFAPNVSYGICTLCGCKSLIEKHAKTGSWVVGIGGNNTGKPDKLIYAMEVKNNLPFAEFKRNYRTKGRYLKPKENREHVLVSNNFFYFGDKAISLPTYLRHIIKHEWGTKCIELDDVTKLLHHLSKKGFKPGIMGNPNNPKPNPNCKRLNSNKCNGKKRASPC